MANELQYYGNPLTESGLNVTAIIYDDLGSVVGGSITTAEIGSLGIYISSMPIVSAGIYVVRFFNGSILLGQGAIEWNGTEEVTLAGLNDFDPSIDIVSRVSLVDITVANSDMRGTDNAIMSGTNSIDTKLNGIETNINELHAIHGLNSNTPMTVTATTRVAGNISQAITGDGTSVSTVIRV